jgi:hypothetical protein
MPAPPIPAAEATRRRLQRQRLRRRLMVFIYGVPLLLLLVALYYAYGPKPPRPPVVLPVSPEQAAAAAQRIDAVRQALTQPPSVNSSAAVGPSSGHASSSHASRPLRATLRSMPPPPVVEKRGPGGVDQVTMRVTQSDINAYLASNPKIHAFLLSRGIHAVSVELNPPDEITVRAAATYQGLSGNGVLTAALTPDPNTVIHLDITDARFGRLPPALIKATADQIVGRLLGRAHGALPLDVRSVQVVGTDLVLNGVRPPAPPHS